MNKKAYNAIIRARTQLLVSQPFYGCLALHMQLVEIEDPKAGCGDTMAVDGRNMYYWPEFVLKLTEEELVGVVAHEVSHCAYQHMTRRNSRDPLIWNIACVEKGTLISTPNGQVRIENLKARDKISTPIGDAKVLTLTTCTKKVLELCLDNGYKLRCSTEHKVMTNEGFIKAGAISKGSEVLVDTRKIKIAQGNGPHLFSTRNSRKGWMHLPSSVISGPSLHPTRGENFLGAHDIFNSSKALNSPLGLLSRNNRRRRNNFLSGGQSQERAPIREAINISGNNQHKFGLLAGICELQGASEAAEYKQAVLLELFNIRVQSGCIVDLDASIFGDQEKACRVLTDLYHNEEATSLALQNLTRDECPSKRTEGIECARVTHVSCTGEECTVYDITTDKHCYVANGIVVHNCDYVINADLLAVPFVLPKNRLHDKQYDGMSTEEVYSRLLKNAKKIKIQYGGKDGKGGEGQDPGGCGGVIDAAAGGNKADADAIGAEWEATVRMAVNAATADNAGRLPGYLQRIVNQLKKPKISWRDQLRHLIDQSMIMDYSWSRPNRRYIGGGLILPGFVPDALHHLIFIVDTSGSVDDKLMQAFLSEVGGALDQGVADKLTVLYADTEVRQVDEFLPGDLVTCNAKGGGGTCFNDSFKWIKENAADAACVIYLTDMMTSSFGEDPGLPVIWGAYLPEHYLKNVNPPFGHILHVDGAD